MNYTRIVIHPPDGGKAIIKGTEISVTQILKLMAAGISREEILSIYVDLHPEDIRQALDFAATVVDTPHTAPLLAPTVIFDLHAGTMEMSDDFDAPLPDSFWIGDA